VGSWVILNVFIIASFPTLFSEHRANRRPIVAVAVVRVLDSRIEAEDTRVARIALVERI
jgi:hypothetical protein